VKLYVSITTCNRAEALSRLLMDLSVSGHGMDMAVSIFDDGSEVSPLKSIKPYIDASSLLGIDYFRYPFNHGKIGYTELISDVLLHAREKTFDYFLNLQDDLRITPTGLQDWIVTMESIEDPEKVALGTYTPKNVMAARWGGKTPKKVSVGKTKVIRTNWIDGNFGCTRAALNLIEYQIPSQDPERWINNPSASSGLGEYLTKAWSKYGMYHPEKSMGWFEDNSSSVMQPEVRSKNPL
jgi:hypothetical protein